MTATGKISASDLKFLQDQEVLLLAGSQAQKLGMKAWLVGGGVRDIFLGRSNTDLDITVYDPGNPQAGIELAQATAAALVETGRTKKTPKVAFFKNFGTAHFHFEGVDYEFVGTRKESYRGESRKPQVQEATPEEDLARRDFTINAMALALNPKELGLLTDHYQGLQDLEKGILRTPLEPEQTYSDDPLRMIRACRFAAQLQFRIAPESLQAMQAQSARLGIVSQERITDELNKLIMAPKPSLGFELLFDTGLLQEFFPEMCALQGVEKVGKHAHKDNFYHTLKVLDNVAGMGGDIWLRWAAILHDIAKPRTKRYEEGTGWTFHGHEDRGARMVPGIFKRLKLPLDQKMKFVQKLVFLHLRPIVLAKETVTDSAVRRLLFEAGEDIDQLMMLCRADITSKNEYRVKKYLDNFDLVERKLKEVEERDRVRQFQPPVSGEDIMHTFGLKPCREVGIIKDRIKEAVLDGDIPNEREPAVALMLRLGKELGLKPRTT